MSDELFGSLRDRIQAYFNTGDPKAVLAPETLADAAQLMLLAGERSYAVVGTLHWIRGQSLPEQERGADFHAAVCLFSVLNTTQPGLIPTPLRSAFAMRPPNVEPLHEILHAVGAALFAEFARARTRDLLDRAIVLFHRAVEAAPHADPSRAAMEFNLGSALSSRFDLTGDTSELSTAIGAMRRAADAIAEEHPGRGQLWFTLGIALARRFNVLHDLADLDACEAALIKASAGYPDQAELARNLEAVRTARTQVIAGAVPAQAGGGALSNQGLVHQEAGRLDEAVSCYLDALPLLRAAGDRVNEGRTLNNLGTTYRLLGRYKESAEQHEAAVAILRELGDQLSTGRTLTNLGVAYRLLGRQDESLGSLAEALQLLRSCGDLQCEGTTLVNLGATYATLGRAEEAIRSFEQAAAIFEQIGNQVGRAQALEGLAWVFDTLGRPEDATRWR
ncbi:tetratricopeptide repeat protein [Sorangium sp. So ce291]|uniref:tetratricopeptide repeat protein n=1 Tax=Sorangium sp. So ce291 TaxID=3133294 RepID=UPI003F614B50